MDRTDWYDFDNDRLPADGNRSTLTRQFYGYDQLGLPTPVDFAYDPDRVARNLLGPTRANLARFRATLTPARSAMFYEQLNGFFQLEHRRDIADALGTVHLRIDNAATEYFVGMLITGQGGVFDRDRIPAAAQSLLRITDYAGCPLIDAIHMTYAKGATFTDVPALHVQNAQAGAAYAATIDSPLTGRTIRRDGITFKRIYRGLRMLKLTYKPLCGFITDDYDVDESLMCVASWFVKNVKRATGDDIKKLLNIENFDKGLTYPEVFEICKYYNCPVECYDIDGDLIDSQPAGKGTRNKKLAFVIHNAHMYVVKFPSDKKTTQMYDDVEGETANATVIVNNTATFIEMKAKVLETFTAVKMSDRTINCKSNQITYNGDYEHFVALGKKLKSRAHTLYNVIDSRFKLRGTLTMKLLDYFTSTNKVRNYTRQLGGSSVRFDLNKAYYSMLTKREILFPIPNISDEWTSYDASVELKHYALYYVKVQNTDVILAPYDDIYTGYELELLKKTDKVKEITAQFIPSRFATIGNLAAFKDLPIRYMRQYIGWLMKRESINRTTYHNIPAEEIEALQYKYGYEGHTAANMFVVSKRYVRASTGVLANIMIKALTNIALFNFDAEFTAKNPSFKLNSIKTDSLGYTSAKPDTHYEKIDAIKGPEVIGAFKIEHTDKHIFTIDGDIDHQYLNETPPPPICILPTNEIESTDVAAVLVAIDNNESLLFDDAGGLGKTYFLKSVIIPHLTARGDKFILTSTTNENTDHIEGDSTVQRALGINSLSIAQIRENFEGVKYLIVDEMSQSTQSIYKHLELIKQMGVALILIGDSFQCLAVDTLVNTMQTNYIKTLAPLRVRFRWHKFARYCKSHYDKLEHIKTIFKNPADVIKYTRKTFNQKGPPTRLNLCYYHKTIEAIKEERPDTDNHTVHSFQGKTIKDENFTIHDVDNMTPNLIYTALSRATNESQIFLAP